ncbi:hypothetical protein GQ55_2G077400 [Panicum hallii var. hallii]|uniref:Uncharacterized protein n=1 Tax=Panicum hallii var. hallii TaxID=1504633 RepID=A0A2T7EMI7_9POAL|nr:hypothetical protein GQ55_2G077400 [Panicum hallii var. hallii]
MYCRPTHRDTNRDTRYMARINLLLIHSGSRSFSQRTRNSFQEQRHVVALALVPNAYRATMCFTSLSMLRQDDPASATQHSTALLFSSTALRRIPAPGSPPPISAAMAASTSPLSSSPSSATPTRRARSTYLAFPIWSPKHGRHSNGNPAHTASSVEFHPQCVQNPPTARCARTSSCGTHATTVPRPRVAARKPLGRGGCSGDSGAPGTRPGRSAQRKGRPLLAMPQTFSARSEADMLARLPKLT